ncbi:MAG: hypothetical protein FWC79_00265 [Oscillospiraceae bacterium]|nr:hypothetical protein [Oscillospiraceae bacterium]
MNVLFILGTIITLFGVILVYDARPITKKTFSFGDQNEGAKGLKMVGFILALIGGLFVFFNI